MKKVLSIAGSDSGGGAGIQADLKAFAARGVYGMTAITALTAQNTLGVQGIYEVEPEFVAKQIDSVMQDIGADIWKTGMLANRKIIQTVVSKFSEYEMEKIVVDPVMVAKGGDHLLNPDAEETVINELIPISFLITPNHHEAEVLTGNKIGDYQDAKKAALILHDKGAQNVLIKGGHLPNNKDAIDILYDGKRYFEISAPRIDSKNTHGTGCTYASSIAAEIAKGNDVEKAVKIAKIYITETIKMADQMRIGSGHGPLNHFLGKTIGL